MNEKRTTLNLAALDAPAIATLFARQIGPMLGRLESDRKEALRVFWLRLLLGEPAALAAGVASFALIGDEVFSLIAGLVLVVMAYFFAFEPLRLVGVQAKSRTLAIIAGELGCSYVASGFAAAGMDLFRSLDLLPGADRESFEDEFTGAHHGCDFALYEGHLERRVKSKNGDSWKTLFRGQLIRIAFPKKFLGTTVVLRDAGFFNFLERWSTKLQRVGLVDSRLEKAFEVYSSDQAEARYLIHPVFMERLLELETQFRGKRLRCGFAGGDLLIAVEGGDRFEIGSMFSRLDAIDRVSKVAADIGGVIRLIDALLTTELSPLPE